MSETNTESKIFYGWFIVIACFFVTMSLGETMWSFGVFFKPLESEFGWSRSLVSSSYTAFLLAYALSSVVSGRMADRYGPRLILVTGGVLSGLGTYLCSQVGTVNELRLFLLLSGLGAGATWSVPTATVQRWFYGRPKAGLALAIVVAGVGIGALVFAPLINYLILEHGWRKTFQITGVLYTVLTVSAALAVRGNPKPSGEGEGARDLMETTELPIVQILTQGSFLIINFAICVTIFALHVISVHFIAYATDMGMSSTVAATAVGLMGILSVLGRLLAGPIADWIGWKKTVTISLFGLTFAATWLLFSRIHWMLYSFAVFFGLFWGSRTTSLNGVMGAFFGMRSLGGLIGITGASSNALAAFVPYVAGWVFDTAGSYTLVFITLALLQLLASFLATILKKPEVAGEAVFAYGKKAIEHPPGVVS